MLFAGDAAHLVPIFGVRGMNSGIDDTHNLAWKLAWVVQGCSPAALLDSYSSERVFAARENIRHASKSTEFMAPPSRAFQLMREAALGLATKDPFFATLINPRQTSAITFADSPLNAADSDALAVRAGARRSARGVSRRNGDGAAAFTELLGPGYTAVCLTGDDPRAALAALRDLPLSVAWVAPRKTAGADAWDATGRLFPLYGAAPSGVLSRAPRRPRRRALARGTGGLDPGGCSARAAIGLTTCSPTRNWTTSTPGRATR